MLKIIAILVSLSITATASGAQRQYRATLVRVIDGDTLELSIDLGFGITFTDKCRLYGVDTPEVFGVSKKSVEHQRGLIASRYVRSVLTREKTFWITPRTSRKGKQLRGKYGRWLITVHLGKTTLRAMLEASGLTK